MHEVGVDHDEATALVAERTKPPLVFRVHRYVGFEVEALEMGTDFATSWHVDWQHRYRVCQVDGHFVGFLVFDHSDLVGGFVSSEELLVALQTHLVIFGSFRFDEVYDVVWLYDLDQKYSNDVARVCKKALVVLLSLEDVDQISTLHRDTCHIEDLIFLLLLVIWRVWDLELLLVSLLIDLHESEFWEAVLKAYAVEPDAPDLYTNRALARPSRIDLREVRLFDDKLFR